MERIRKGAKEGGWTTVRRINKNRSNLSERRDDRSLEGGATTFFVSNIPDGCSASKIWKIFQQFGCLVDVYVARKRDRMGQCFGFARFIKVQHEEKLEKDLSNIFIEKRRLVVNVSKYKRKAAIQLDPLKEKGSRRGNNEHVSSAGIFVQNLRGSKSYLEAVSGDNFNRSEVPCKYQSPSLSGKKVIKIPEAIIPKSFQKFEGCLLGEAKDIDSLENFFNIFNASGLVDCSLKYLGGLNVLIDFGRKDVAEAFLLDHAEGWRKWFAWLKVWDESFIQNHRIIWIKVSGLPIQLWESVFFDVIAERFGRVLIRFEGSLQARNCSYGRLCILAKQDSLINECVEVCWKGLSCWVRVQEDSEEWSPPCTLDSSDLESENESIDGNGGEGDYDDDLGGEKVKESVDGTDRIDVQAGNFCCSGMGRTVVSSPPVENLGDRITGNGINDFSIDASIPGPHGIKDISIEASIPGTHAKEKFMQEDVVASEYVNEMGRNMGFCSVGPGLNLEGDEGCNSSNNGVSLGLEKDGPGGTHVLPDLNHVIESSNKGLSESVSACSSNLQTSNRNKRSSKKGVYSLKLKDLIRKPSRGKSHTSRRMNGGSVASDYISNSSPVVSLNSTSVEIEKTIKLGLDVGFQMDDFREDLRTIIEGEGASKPFR